MGGKAQRKKVIGYRGRGGAHLRNAFDIQPAEASAAILHSRYCPLNVWHFTGPFPKAAFAVAARVRRVNREDVSDLRNSAREHVE